MQTGAKETIKFAMGNYSVELKYTIDTIDGIIELRVNKIYINKISSMYEGMLLSEWLTYDTILELLATNVGITNKVVFSRQPRKRLRRFNIRHK